MKKLSLLGLLLGLAAATVLVARAGFGDIGAALISLGAGVLLLPLVFLPHLALAAASWRLLFTAERMPRFTDVLRASWMGLSVDTLLPTASIGGEVVKARCVMQAGATGGDAVASVVVDKTVQAASLVFWGLIGVASLTALEAGREIVVGALVGSALLAAGIAGFIAVQRAGAFGFLARFAGRGRRTDKWNGLIDNAVALDEAIRALYRSPGRIAGATALRLVARLALTVEVWLAAALLGNGITVFEAVMLKSLTGALRGAAFFVPGAWGIQEGGYVVLGALIGLTPEFMLALSLATRAREALVALPGLLAWQHAEGRWLWRRRRAGADSTPRDPALRDEASRTTARDS